MFKTTFILLTQVFFLIFAGMTHADTSNQAGGKLEPELAAMFAAEHSHEADKMLHLLRTKPESSNASLRLAVLEGYMLEGNLTPENLGTDKIELAQIRLNILIKMVKLSMTQMHADSDRFEHFRLRTNRLLERAEEQVELLRKLLAQQ